MSASSVARYNGPTTLMAQLQFAEELAKSNLLPDSFRRSPANVLWSIEYAKTLNVSVLAAITGIHVMDGKPTASAGLMTALVRRAGHTVRTRTTGTVSGGDFSATCTIIRHDDLEHPFEVTWDLDRAVRAELIDELVIDERGKTIVIARTPKGKASNWQKYTETMCKHRAESECARDAAEDALYGLHYTPEELGAEVDFTADGHTIVTGEVLTDGDEPGDDPRAWRSAMEMARIALDERDPQRLANGYAIAEKEQLLDWDVSTVLSDEDDVRAGLAGDNTLGALIRLMGSRRAAEVAEREEKRRQAMEQNTVDAEVVEAPAPAASPQNRPPRQRQPEPEPPAAEVPAEPSDGAKAAAAKLAVTGANEDNVPRLRELYRAAGDVLLRTDVAGALTPQQKSYVAIPDGQPIELGAWLMACAAHVGKHGDSVDTSITLDPAHQEAHAS